MKNNLLEWRRYNEIRPFFDELVASGDLSTAHMASFWRKTLEKRYNFPSFNDIITFRRGLASSIGYGFRINEDSEQRTFLRMFGRGRALAPLQYLQANLESNVGQPYQFYKDGILSSSAGIDNVANTYRIETMLREYQVTPSEHRILEIGAGYGGVAEVLIRHLNPAVYVVCDLPHNLFLAAFYLATNYPEHNLYFVNDHPPERIDSNALVFATPKGLECIQDYFTLVVNTFSFQEMPMAEIRRYFNFIHQHLAEDGLFYFFNHHRVADGAQKPADYPFDQFAVRRWGPMPVTQQYIFGPKQAYEVVMQTNKGETLPPYFDSVTQTLSLLMFMAVNSHLEDMCARLIRGAISEEELACLADLHQVFTSRSARAAREKLEKLHTLPGWQPITWYVSALLRFFEKDKQGAAEDFKRALEEGLKGFARTRALLFLSLVAHSREERQEYILQAVENTPQHQSELEAGDLTLDQFKLSYQYAFPFMRLNTMLIPHRLRRMLARAVTRKAPNYRPAQQ